MEKMEAQIKRENKLHAGAEKMSTAIANGIPNQRDDGGGIDAVNAGISNGQMQGSHPTNINTQTDLELGGAADPGGIDPAMDREFLKNMGKKVNKE